MAVYKRKRTFGKKYTKKYSKKSRSKTGVKAVVKRLLKSHDKKMIETKHSMESFTDNQQINHNNFITITTTPFTTNTGTNDPSTGRGARIGDDITPTGYSYKMMVELNERISDCTYRLLVVKAAKGDIPTRTSLFVGQSANKIMDNIDYERYSVIHQKYFKLKAPNHGTNSGNFVQFAGGTYMENAANEDFTMTTFATKIIRGFIPASKFTTRGVLKYENYSNQIKFFDYHVLLYGYANGQTSQDLMYVGRVNEFIGDLKYTDS